MSAINASVLDNVKAAGKKLVVVTKYYDGPQTQAIIKAVMGESCVMGWGENRTAALETKQLDPFRTHFIGRLQSRQLPLIVEHCHYIHSLASLKHAQKINHLIEQNNYSKVNVFIQVNVAQDPSKEGIAPNEIPVFLKAIEPLEQLTVVGLSNMGWGEFDEATKRQEFKALINLQQTYLPEGLTSAGTSRDYVLALEEGIDIVRVGKGILAGSF